MLKKVELLESYPSLRLQKVNPFKDISPIVNSAPKSTGVLHYPHSTVIHIMFLDAKIYVFCLSLGIASPIVVNYFTTGVLCWYCAEPNTKKGRKRAYLGFFVPENDASSLLEM